MIFFYISLSTYICFNIIKYKKIFSILQKNKYDFKSYNNYLKEHSKEILLNKELLSIVLIIIAVNFNLKIIGISTVIFYTILFLLDYKKKYKVKRNKKLVTRIILITLAYFILNMWFILDYISYHYADIIFDNTAFYYIIMIIISYFSYYIIWLINLIAILVDKLLEKIGGKHVKSKLKKSKTGRHLSSPQK